MSILKEYQDCNRNLDAKIQVAGFAKESIVDGPGVRFAIFCQGCPHNCKGCHNPGTHEFNEGRSFKVSEIIEAIDKNPILQGVTFSGGEPLCQVESFLALAKEVKVRSLHLVIYTGYTIEELEDRMTKEPALKDLLLLTDILIEGRYVDELRDISLIYRGSKNQRVIDLKEYFKSGKTDTMKNINI